MHKLINTFFSSGRGVPPPGLPPGGQQAPADAWALRKLLVVDDERDLADMAEVLLHGSGLEVKVAYSGLEALLILENDPEIDALFSDIMMPGMTGLQLANAVSALYPRVRIVLTSGFTPPSLMSTRQRPYHYLPKPYSMDMVLKLLRSGPKRP
ncbi:response regulator [Massilia sp. SM-13]|uniref:response regulator n=1 Tax=Pseudoduganella rhizocola TaxID=3382643 RepID=UPI0038B4B4E7